METRAELEIVKVSKENVGGLFEIFKACFNANVDRPYFEWKYFANPIGDAIAFMALDGERVAAFYGVIPEKYSVADKEVLVFQSMDTMTHPDYQRRGLFSKLANVTYDYVTAEFGEHFLVGIPGMSSFPGFVKKLNWKDIHMFQFLFLPKAIFKFRRPFRSQTDAEFTAGSSMTSDLEQFLSRQRVPDKKIRPVLSPAFFKWRVFGHPFRGYKVIQIRVADEIIGICVFIIEENGRSLICFTEFSKHEHYSRYSAALMDHLFSVSGSRILYTWEPLTELLRHAYGRCEFIKNPFKRGPFSYRNPLIVRSNSEYVGSFDIFNIANYDLQPLMQD